MSETVRSEETASQAPGRFKSEDRLENMEYPQSVMASAMAASTSKTGDGQALAGRSLVVLVHCLLDQGSSK